MRPGARCPRVHVLCALLCSVLPLVLWCSASVPLVCPYAPCVPAACAPVPLCVPLCAQLFWGAQPPPA